MRIFDYVKRTKKTFSELKFNELDALVFSNLAYINYGNILKRKKMALKDVYKRLDFNNSVFAIDRFNYQNVLLFKALSESPRFQNIILEHYERKNTATCQFAALTIKVPRYLTYIAFEGTEDLLEGWEEDCRFSYEFPTDSQKMAYKYVKKHIKFKHFNIYIGGHSKGGNLAISAMLPTNWLTRLKVKKLFNFDGPGFLEEVVNTREYKRVQNKIISYYPEESIIGMLLENNTKKYIVKSSYKKVQQHNCYSWRIKEYLFERGTLSELSKKMHKRVQKICERYTKEERKFFVNTLFNLLDDSGYEKKSEFDHINIRKLIGMVKNLKNLKKEEKTILVDMFKLLLIEEKSV